MKFQELLRRALAGEHLNALETAELEACNYDQLKQENLELKHQLSQTANAQISVEENLRQELQKVTAERDEAQHSQARLSRQIRVRELAAQAGCRDAAYFDFCAQQQELDLENAAQVAEFVHQLTAQSPQCFTAHIQPGGGAGTPDAAPPPADDASATVPDRIDQIMVSLGNAPEVR